MVWSRCVTTAPNSAVPLVSLAEVSFCRHGLTTTAIDPGLDSVGRGICRICHVDKKPCLHVPVELIGVGRVLTTAIGYLRGLQHIGMPMGIPTETTGTGLSSSNLAASKKCTTKRP